jgi:hypothetical protein
MLWALLDLFGGWKTIRARAGFIYQVSRGGKRRIVPIEGWRKPGLRDEGWVVTGRFADDLIVSKYGDFHVTQHHLRQRKSREREHAAA